MAFKLALHLADNKPVAQGRLFVIKLTQALDILLHVLDAQPVTAVRRELLIGPGLNHRKAFILNTQQLIILKPESLAHLI